MSIFKRLAKVSYKDGVTNEEVLRRLGVVKTAISNKNTRCHIFTTLQDMPACRKQSSQVEWMVQEEGTDPEVSGTTT